MKLILITVMLLGTLVTRAYTAVTAQESDLVIDCGTDNGGPVSVTYTNSDPATNLVKKLSSPKNRATCSATDNGSGVFTISDVRTNCDILQPNMNVPEYWLQLTMQEFTGLYMNDDPTFLVRCSYSVGKVDVSTTLDDGGPVGIPTQVTVESTGNPDMTYTLQMVENTPAQTVLTSARFGQMVALQVLMSGTDDDEQGVRVESCNMTSGDAQLTIIEDFCVVPDLREVFLLDNFMSSGTQASFPITLFALEGSNSNSVEFTCVAEVCPAAPCQPVDCSAPAGKRKRRAAGDEITEQKTVKMAAKIEILPIVVSASGSEGQTGQTGQQESSSLTCMQSLGFIVTVAVLGVLLLIAMVTVFYMFTSRRRELQKSGA